MSAGIGPTQVLRGKIGDFCLVTDYVANGSFASLRENVQYLSEPGYAVLVRLRDHNSNWNGDYVFVSERAYRFLSKSSLKPGDIVVSNVGDPGQVFIVPDVGMPMTLGPNSILLRPDESVATPGYIYSYLRSPAGQAQIQSIVTETAQRKFNKTGFRELQVPLPPLAEQRRIAEILDRAEALRAKRRAALAQVDTLTQSIFLDLFGDPARNPKGWSRVPFGELLTKIDSGWSPICLDRPVVGNEWGVLKLGAVTWCEYNAAENKAMLPNVAPDPELEVQPGDLLFTRKNTYELVAACALVQATPPRLQMSDLIFRFRLRPEAKIDACFLHQLLIYPTKRLEMQKLAGGSAGSMPNISKARLQTATIEVPPLSIQREFARRVGAVEKLKAAHRASLAELDALFVVLQHRAFRGEL
jgi:type I restriction enzyme, S subunit